MTRPHKPNIVLILADDLGYGDLGCQGAELVETPNVDRLAREGIRFTDAHSPCSVCTPSRYNLLTGRHCWRTWAKTGCIWIHDPLLIEDGQPTIASVLRDSGYTTGLVGKWHLGFGRPGAEGWDDLSGVNLNGRIDPGPCEVGFDSFFGVSAVGKDPNVYIENHHVVGLDENDPIEVALDTDPAYWTDYYRRPRTRNPQIGMNGGAAAQFDFSDLGVTLTRRARSHIEENARGEKPFFLYFAHRNVHSPLKPHPRFEGTSPIGVYGDFIHELDWSVGEILAALDEQGILDDTLVIFASDNGATEMHRPVTHVNYSGHRANGPLRGQKSEVFEGGHRIPLIARWPGHVPAGTTSSQLIALTDMLATFAGLVGARLPDDAGPDSFDLLPAMLGEDGPRAIRPYCVHDSMQGQMFAIRSGEWKLILGQGGGGIGGGWDGRPGIERFSTSEPAFQLYNLTDDLAEERNGYERYPDIARRLVGELEAIRQEGRSR
jgi:arylsulfatase A-like enzyme